jgi:hypothetical protein
MSYDCFCTKQPIYICEFAMSFQACNKGMVRSDTHEIAYTVLLKRLLHEITVLI